MSFPKFFGFGFVLGWGLQLLAAPLIWADSFAEITFINATSNAEPLTLKFGSDQLGSDNGLPSGETDGPYLYQFAKYSAKLMQGETELASKKLDIHEEDHFLILARDVPSKGDSKEKTGPKYELTILPKSKIPIPPDEPFMLVLSLLPKGLDEFQFGDDQGPWPFGEFKRLSHWVQPEIVLKGKQGWIAEMEWSAQRVEEEPGQMLIVFVGGENVPIITRYVFASAE